MLGWCAATLTSVALASVAMLPVLRTATPDESALVSVEQLRDGGSSAPATLPAVPPGPSASASRSAQPTVAPTSPTPAREPHDQDRAAQPHPVAGHHDDGDDDRGRLDGDHGR